MLTAGIDLGGTNLRAAIFGDDPTQPLARHKEPVGDERSPEAIAERLAAAVAQLAEQAGADSDVPVGIGLAAMLGKGNGMVANSPHLRWRDLAFGPLLDAALGQQRWVLYNDVDAITYGEYKAGAAQGNDDTLAVFVGTGIGAGVIANGQLVRGANSCAGEIGHVKIAFGDDALPCACGSRGCIEAYAGGNYVQRRARRELTAGARSAAVDLAGGDPTQVTPAHLDAAASDGDEYALDLFDELAPMLGGVLANVCTVLNPGCLILGGGMMSRTPLFREHVITAFEVAINPPALAGLTIADAALGDDAGLVGSALLARRDLDG